MEQKVWALPKKNAIHFFEWILTKQPDSRLYAWNPDAWRQASDVTAKAANLRNKKYLMVHGTADDNVHYQQSMMLARAMEEADVLFRCTMFHT